MWGPISFFIIVMILKNSVHVNSFSNDLGFGDMIKKKKKPMSTFVAITFIGLT